MKNIRQKKPRKQPEEYVKHVLLTEEGQERLFRLIRSKYPAYDDDQCRELLWGNTEAPYAEYRVIRKQLEEYLNVGEKEDN